MRQQGKQSMANADSLEQKLIAAEVCWKQEPILEYISPSPSPLTRFFPLNAQPIVLNLLLHPIETPSGKPVESSDAGS
jgi:hypothetical protein